MSARAVGELLADLRATEVVRAVLRLRQDRQDEQPVTGAAAPTLVAAAGDGVTLLTPEGPRVRICCRAEPTPSAPHAALAVGVELDGEPVAVSDARLPDSLGVIAEAVLWPLQREAR